MATYHFSQSGAGSANGTSEANAWSLAQVNTSGNWSGTPATSGKISPGDTLIAHGTITGTMRVLANGQSGNPITILWATGAKFSAPYFTAGWAIDAYNRSWLTFDGAATGQIGGYTGNPALANGIIECTDNGTVLTYQVHQTGIRCAMGAGITVKNLVIRNLFVRTPGDRGDALEKGGSAITNANVNTASVHTFIVDNCILHDMATGIDTDFAGNAGQNHTYNFTRNTIYNCNWGGRAGSRQNNSHGVANRLTGLLIEGNYFHSFANWDGPSIGSAGSRWHHNGFFAWNYTEAHGGYTDLIIRNNVVRGPYTIPEAGWPNSSTSGFFVLGPGVRQIYNNLLLNLAEDGGTGPSGGMLDLGDTTSGITYVFNNTIIRQGGIGIKLATFQEGYDWVIKNNIITGCTAISKFYAGTPDLDSDKNLFHNLPGSQNFNWAFTSSSSFKTFAQWKAISAGHDPTSTIQDPLLTSTYRLGVGSPAIGAGENLSAFFTTDAVGNPRPATGGWDIGAYQSESPVTVHHVTQSGAGAANGTSQANAWSVTQLNTSSNWSATEGTAGKISPGDTVMLHGTISTRWQVWASGTSTARITILFAPGAKMSAANWGTNGAITMTTKHYITIDGGATGTIGGINGDPSHANGIIECTDNGSELATQVGSRGVLAWQSNHLTVRGLVVRNIYVRVKGPETTQWGSCVHNEGSNADFTDFLVENCILNHAFKAIHADFNQTSARYTFQDLTITYTNHSIQCGARGSASTLDGVILRRSKISEHENWDGTDTDSRNAMHHNGFYAFATQGTSRFIGVEIYDNVFGPVWGESTTAGTFFVSQGASEVRVYNNVFLGVSDNPSNGYVTAGVGDGSVVRIYNNTFAGSGGGLAVSVGGNRSSFWINNSDPVDPEAFDTYVYNNLSVNKIFAFFSYGLIATAVDRNLVFNAPVTPGPYATGSADSGVYRTFAQWQDLGYDANGIFGSDPLLTETYRLGASSPAIGTGENLSAYFTTDAAGNTRPASGAWDIGAFQYGEAPPPTPPAGRGRKRRGAKLLSFFR